MSIEKSNTTPEKPGDAVMQDVMDIAESAYGLQDVRRVEKADVGISNQTFFVEFPHGKYVLQVMHSIFSEQTNEDVDAITMELEKRDWLIPKLTRTKSGSLTHSGVRGLYRMYAYIPGSTVTDIESLSANHVEAAAKLLRKLHDDLGTITYLPKFHIDHFHDTPYLISKLEGVMSGLSGEPRALAEKVINAYKGMSPLSDTPLQLIHGDPRIENFLFDARNAPFTIIDFDTLMTGSRYIDVGDFLRSLSVTDGQTRAVVRREVIDAALSGYWGAGLQDMSREVHFQHGYHALRNIVLELSARFLTDVAEDKYFGWDNTKYPTRAAHNFARALGQWKIYESIADI